MTQSFFYRTNNIFIMIQRHTSFNKRFLLPRKYGGLFRDYRALGGISWWWRLVDLLMSTTNETYLVYFKLDPSFIPHLVLGESISLIMKLNESRAYVETLSPPILRANRLDKLKRSAGIKSSTFHCESCNWTSWINFTDERALSIKTSRLHLKCCKVQNKKTWTRKLCRLGRKWDSIIVSS